MRLIDADALMRKAWKNVGKDKILHRIPPHFVDDAPTVDALPIRHGHWVKENIRKGSYLRLCTVCGKVCYFCGTGCSYKYCPNCGAKMDKKEERL